MIVKSLATCLDGIPLTNHQAGRVVQFGWGVILVVAGLCFVGCNSRQSPAQVASQVEQATQKEQETHKTKPAGQPIVQPAVGPVVARTSFEEPDLMPTPPNVPLPADASAVQPIEKWSEQQLAADALGRIGPAAVPSLVDALTDPAPEVRLRVVQVLGRMGSDAKEAVPAVIRLLDDEDDNVRRAAARTLGQIGPDAAAAVPNLMRALLKQESE